LWLVGGGVGIEVFEEKLLKKSRCYSTLSALTNTGRSVGGSFDVGLIVIEFVEWCFASGFTP